MPKKVKASQKGWARQAAAHASYPSACSRCTRQLAALDGLTVEKPGTRVIEHSIAARARHGTRRLLPPRTLTMDIAVLYSYHGQF
eukprot:scaffold308727_cov36-Tisochrysis_lutea.AAC.1